MLIFGGFILISTVCGSPMLFFGKTFVLRDTFFEFCFLYDFSRENIFNSVSENRRRILGRRVFERQSVAGFHPPAISSS